ncbi:hypothetical protein BDV12DRAFT_184794 [Aspergillus spectabilis]
MSARDPDDYVTRAGKRQKNSHGCSGTGGSTRSLTHNGYTIAWICPLEVELIAALEMLDEPCQSLPQQPSDRNIYTLGSIDCKNVVIATLGVPGNNAAAAVIGQMRMTFPESALRIFLGDVVVSKPTSTQSGAVQYDHGKIYNGQFERTGALSPLPTVLLQAAQSLATQRARSRLEKLENIGRVDLTIPALAKFRYPGNAKGFLYPPGYLHQQPDAPCYQCGCDSHRRIMSSPDDVATEAGDDEPPRAVVHWGTIPSGEYVIKEGRLRDRIAAENGILFLEIEAAGSLTDFLCLIIRGISDWKILSPSISYFSAQNNGTWP